MAPRFRPPAERGDKNASGVKVSKRLWRTIKYEEVYLRAYESVREARVRIEAYMGFYNDERPHQALCYRTPAQVYHEASDQLSETAAADSLNTALSLSK